jgi:adenylyltransferase/sulfurtransferase
MSQPINPQMELTPQQTKLLLDEGKLLLIDCRTPTEFELVHVAGAQLLPLDQIESRHDEVEPEPGQTVAVMCHHGVRSLKAAHALRALGHGNVMSVAGGIDLWSLQVDKRVGRYERSTGVPRFVG